MEWTYTIVKPLSINSRSLHDVYYAKQHWATPHDVWFRSGAELTFNTGEIDQHLYESLVKGYPDHVKRTPKNPLVAAVYAARGLP